MRRAVIDEGALSDNVRALRERVGVPIIAVVKADGYGHGAATTASAALRGGASQLGVADLSEAVALRRAGIDAPILAWLHDPDEDFSRAAEYGISVGISRLAQLSRAALAGRDGAPLTVHLKLETGLGRNGIAPEEADAAFAEAARAEASGALRVEGLFSHLSNTTTADDERALARFLGLTERAAAAGLRPSLRHIAASHAAIALPDARLDAVRIGIAMYGLSPFDHFTSRDLGLRPAMRLSASVAAVRRVPADQGVSYGYLHRTREETTLALIPLGYADGVPRAASGGGAVRIGEKTFPVAGRIAMDQFVVDVGDHPVSVGDEAVLFGDPEAGDPPVEAWARSADTINYEIVTRIGPRVTRVGSHT